MPTNHCSDYGWRREPMKLWRYPGVPIPERLRRKYTSNPQLAKKR